MLKVDAESSTGSDFDDQLIPSISTVRNVLAGRTLRVPAYQRPYKWTAKNVSELVSDIDRFRSAGHYRIGTFILHDPADSRATIERPAPLDIVDGQQRYLTFALIATALHEAMESDEASQAEGDAELIRHLIEAKSGVRLPVRNDGRSELNLRQNYAHLRQLFGNWNPDDRRLFTEFFLEECSVVVLQVRDLDAAFQMFDSQNTRGRALYPTDLLKAYHLREFRRTTSSMEDVLATVRMWESVEPAEINHVIASVLYPIKVWSANRSLPRKGFTSQEIDLFKGIKEGKGNNGRYRWARHALLAKAAVDRFQLENATLLRHDVVEELEYPFLITQPVIDGDAFFQMVHHYVRETRLAGVEWDRTGKTPRDPHKSLEALLDIINEMPSGTGNGYVRSLFECFMIAFTDRFGWEHAEEASWVLARHAYQLRVILERVQTGSIDTHALFVHPRVQAEDENLFVTIAQSLDPNVILSRPAPTVQLKEKHPRPLRKLFERRGGSMAREDSKA